MAATVLDSLETAAGTGTDGAPAPNPAGADGSLGVRLGLADPLLEGLKQPGVGQGAALSHQQIGTTKKRPKMTHALFFENDNGMKKVLKTFPNIKLKGKGREFEDVSLLLQHYKKWLNELYPYGEHFEDLVWKARQVLQDKEKEDDGTISDPRERLHAFRLQYKNTPKPGASLSEEARARIEANRQRALELKRQKQGGANSSSATGAAPAEELDMEELWRMEEEAAAASKKQASAAPPVGFDDEEDPFGFSGGGFDFDDDSGAVGPGKASKPVAKASTSAAFDDEEDVFGFGGGGFDDMDPFPAPPPKPSAKETVILDANGEDVLAERPNASPPAEAKAPVASGVDPEIAKRIAENRAKALERKAAAAAAAAAVDAAAAPVAEKLGDSGEPGMLGSAPMDDDEDGFDFGCSGFDDP